MTGQIRSRHWTETRSVPSEVLGTRRLAASPTAMWPMNIEFQADCWGGDGSGGLGPPAIRNKRYDLPDMSMLTACDTQLKVVEFFRLATKSPRHEPWLRRFSIAPSNKSSPPPRGVWCTEVMCRPTKP